MKLLLTTLTDWKRQKTKNGIKNWKVQLREVWRGLLASLFCKTVKERKSCDVLIVHPSVKSFNGGRKARLLELLRTRGIVVEEYIEPSSSLKLKNRHFTSVKGVPLWARWEAYSAKYFLERFNAKVIVTERNGWVIPSYIKKLRTDKPVVVHLAHSIINNQSSKYDYHDYDYYFMYGRSSLDYLRSLTTGYGTTEVVFCGPYFMAEEKQPEIKRFKDAKAGRSIVFLASGPDYEELDSYNEICCWIRRLLAEAVVDSVYIKLHPRGRVKQWKSDEERWGDRFCILEDDDLFQSVLQSCDCVLMGYTNAIIDVSLKGIPAVMLGTGSDYFKLEKFSMPWAESYEKLKNILQGDRLEFNQEFLQYHVSGKDTGAISVVNAIEDVLSGDVVSEFRLVGRFE